ncbi:TPA: hypothetical protein ACRZZI_005189 [Vibrio harveyi]
MSSDRKIASFISFSLPLCMGLIVGMIIFNPSEDFVMWWKSIDWKEQGVANVGAWVAGIATSLAALATASAARSSARAADAATKSADQWKLHSSYEKYIDTGVKARIKLRWLEAHIKHMCERRFQVFYVKGSSIEIDTQANDVEAFISCLNPNFIYEDIDAANRFAKYIEEFKYQADSITKLYPDTITLIEETYELSKNHVGLSETEKKVILNTIEEFMGQVRMISCLYQEVVESTKTSIRAKKVHVDSCLKCHGASQHYYRSTMSNLRLVSGYIDNLVIDSNFENWTADKLEHIEEEQNIFKLVTDGSGGHHENVIKSIAKKFERL